MSAPAAAPQPEPWEWAADRGHYTEPDPPGGGTGLTAANRWTCTRDGCEAFVIQYGSNIYGPAVDTECTGARRGIDHTQHSAFYPWPEDLFIQGGHGWASSKGYHDEWFFEAEGGEPGMFLRGTGGCMRHAEAAAWTAWQKQQNCPNAPEHGPFDRRSYRNGAGWCTKCGQWFARVLPPLPADPDNDAAQLRGLAQAAAHLLRARADQE